MSLSALAVLTAMVLPAAASAARSYFGVRRCLLRGDVPHGDVYLSITLAAKYFSSYRLCVTPAGFAEGRACKRFKIVPRSNGVYGSTVRWSRHFSNEGGGNYRATWAAGGAKLGPRITFTR